jgi:hypothetical protein
VGWYSDVSLSINQNFITLFLCSYFNSFFLFSAITNIIFAYPQPVRRVPSGVRVQQVGNHYSRLLLPFKNVLPWLYISTFYSAIIFQH